MSNIRLQLQSKKKNAFPLSLKYGILQREMFAVKNMDINSNLLRLKLDMVYRDLSPEEAEKRFTAASQAPKPQVVEPQPVKRKTVKGLVPKK
jgi:hypothetical protein